MKEEVIERRREMLAYHRQGLSVKDWAPQVASKFQVTEDAVKRDWSRRRIWIHLFLKFDNPIELAKNLLIENEDLSLDAQNLYEQIDDPGIRLQVMWLRLGINKARLNIQKEMGAFCQIKFDFEEKTRVYKQNVWDDKDPSRKGNEDYKIRKQALMKCLQDRAYFE